ncbi:hypothetical protein GALL_494170 [mine drainage metagenome]|uniref:Uncharacterized protein n=1 Tax=mine drainage metagenome TaxID=410659 RepID=A0A1J5PDY7_9ZZZZ
MIGHGHDVAAVGQGLQQRDVLRLARRIDDKKKLLTLTIRALTRDRHQIVEDASLRIGEQGVTLLAFRQALNVHRHQSFQRGSGAVSAQGHLTHMGNVEQAGTLPRVQMLGQDARRVLHRHGIAGKRHHAGTEFEVQSVQRGVKQVG